MDTISQKKKLISELIDLFDEYSSQVCLSNNFNENRLESVSKLFEIKQKYQEYINLKEGSEPAKVNILNLNDLQKQIKKSKQISDLNLQHEADIASRHYKPKGKSQEMKINHFLHLSKNLYQTKSFEVKDEHLIESIKSELLEVLYSLKYLFLNKDGSGRASKSIKEMYDRNKNALYYRGHTSDTYKLKPSLYRNKGYTIQEDRLHKNTYALANNHFTSTKRRLDDLTIMQHYGLPTRLLDITKNPLIALFFAVQSDDNSDGELIVFEVNDIEVKDYNSDSVEILSTLSILNHYEKDTLFYETIKHITERFVNSFEINKNNESVFNKDKFYKEYANMIKVYNKEPIVKKLSVEIAKKTSVYLNEIDPITLLLVLPVNPTPNNNRIIRQQGAFWLPGLFNESSFENILTEYRMKKKLTEHKNSPREDIEVEEEILEEMLKEMLKEMLEEQKFPKLLNALALVEPEIENDVIRYIIPKDSKENLRKELELFGIDESTVYPEIENVTKMLSERYRK